MLEVSILSRFLWNFSSPWKYFRSITLQYHSVNRFTIWLYNIALQYIGIAYIRFSTL
jgi:hypothetical protein